MKSPLQICLLAMLIMGCSSNSSGHKYYKFSDQTEAIEKQIRAPETPIYLDQVSILGVSNQQAFVQFTQPNTVNIASFHFWAEHPESMLTQLTLSYLNNRGLTVIPRTLAGDLNTTRYSLKLVVDEYAGHYEKGAILSGNLYFYQLQNGNTHLVQTKRFSFENQLQDDGFDALVAAHKSNWLLLLNDVEQILTGQLRQNNK
ncbi:PqiC family protein [Pseudoalteromonas luteoviolacea]|uniref:PqiC family protein n=1 Tax=Pseudoalteromonas luteoviolacea TaxID=43657 RepID=UPI001B397B2E|nr:ABC-type transport auxiliary lipoprotein family protein [Pseudoalteromonas luteoviolacea]MBQ4835043.1 membrane integrity-associated transporter subunit PqiC [Pseudoalteromonas luteoviolacea]